MKTVPSTPYLNDTCCLCSFYFYLSPLFCHLYIICSSCLLLYACSALDTEVSRCLANKPWFLWRRRSISPCHVCLCVLCVVTTLWGHICVRRPYSQVVSPRLLIWSELEPNTEARWRMNVVEGENTIQPSPPPSIFVCLFLFSRPSYPGPAHTVSP